MNIVSNWKSEYKWKILLMILLYRVSLETIYIWGISPLFSYAFLTTDLNFLKYGISLCVMVVTILLFPTKSQKTSTYLFTILYSITYTPLACYYWMNNQSTEYFLYLSCCFVIIEIFLNFDMKGITIEFPNAKMAIEIIFICYVAATILIVVSNGGINTNTLSFSTVYAARSENDISGAMGYMLNWCAKACMPAFFSYYLYKKNFKIVLITIILQLLLYLSTGFKSFLIAIALLVIIGSIAKYSKRFTCVFIGLLSLGNVGALLLHHSSISNTPLTLLPYRTLFIPAQGQYEYYTFFSHNPHLFFSEGALGGIFGIGYPYDNSIGFIVNQYIYGPSKESNGNTGVFSYAFADFDFAGMLLAAAILIVIFILIDSALDSLPKGVTVGALAYPMVIMNDMNLLITLNTGGLLINLILLIILNSLEKKEMSQIKTQEESSINKRNGVLK